PEALDDALRLFRQLADIDERRGFEAHAALRFVDRIAQAAHLVDQLDRHGLHAGPHVTAPDRVDRVARQPATVGDRAEEAAVHVAERVEQARALLGGVWPEPALAVGVRALLVEADVDAELLDEAR